MDASRSIARQSACTVEASGSAITPPRIVLFGHNRNDVAFTRRVAMLQRAGTDLTTFSFRRDSAPLSPATAWRDVDLGPVAHRRFGQRLWRFARAIRCVLRQSSALRQADVVQARNLDMYLFAWCCLALAGRWRKPRCVYECLDVHLAMTQGGLPSAVLRWLERRVLAHCDLLVVSSPGYIRQYFQPQQRLQTPWLLVENKLVLPPNNALAVAPVTRPARVASRPLTLVWTGIIRCQSTLELMIAVARALPDAVQVRVCGQVSHFIIDDFAGQVDGIDNLVFEGPYRWPDDLAQVYRDADFCWAQDLRKPGHNSTWLIPNRVYEASYFGVLPLAVAGSETARLLEARALGTVLPDARPETLCKFIASVDRQSLRARQVELTGQRRGEFVSVQRDADYLQARWLGRAN